MTEVRWERYPLVAATPHARNWLAIQANLGLAPNTVEAYGRALQDFLDFSARRPVAAETANREHIAAYVGDLTSRPNRPGAAVRAIDSGVGLANATLQQRVTAVRNGRTELEQRLLADECELCGSRTNVEIHHIRALKDLTTRGRAEKPAWVRAMAARQRKTLIVCRTCHQDIQYGRPLRRVNAA